MLLDRRAIPASALCVVRLCSGFRGLGAPSRLLRHVQGQHRYWPASPTHVGTSLTHGSKDEERPVMVSTGKKAVMRREATASCIVHLPLETIYASGVSPDGKACGRSQFADFKKKPDLGHGCGGGRDGSKAHIRCVVILPPFITRRFGCGHSMAPCARDNAHRSMHS
jgi:hypothetical protein